jgi:hypothetical protein
MMMLISVEEQLYFLAQLSYDLLLQNTDVFQQMPPAGFSFTYPDLPIDLQTLPASIHSMNYEV